MDSQNFTNKQAIVMALYRLGAAEHAVDTEDLAIKVVEIVPRQFRWKKHPEQINIESVRLVAKNLLTDVPPLISGSMRNGWMLTPEGIAWCGRILGEDHGSPNVGGALHLRNTSVFRKFLRNSPDDITVHDVRHFLRVDEYTSMRRRKERSQATINIAMEDEELSELVAYLRVSFPQEWK